MRHCPKNSDLQWSFFTVIGKFSKWLWESYAKVTFKSLLDERLFSLQYFEYQSLLSFQSILAFAVWVHSLRIKIISRQLPLRSKVIYIYLKRKQFHKQISKEGKVNKLIQKIIFNEFFFRLISFLDFIRGIRYSLNTLRFSLPDLLDSYSLPVSFSDFEIFETNL